LIRVSEIDAVGGSQELPLASIGEGYFVGA